MDLLTSWWTAALLRGLIRCKPPPPGSLAADIGSDSPHRLTLILWNRPLRSTSTPPRLNQPGSRMSQPTAEPASTTAGLQMTSNEMDGY